MTFLPSSGSSGNDTVFARNGDDEVRGGDGNDLIIGDAGDDILSGNDDNDHLFGGRDDDTMFGGNGNDMLSVETNLSNGFGDDRLSGGAGFDRVTFRDRQSCSRSTAAPFVRASLKSNAGRVRQSRKHLRAGLRRNDCRCRRRQPGRLRPIFVFRKARSATATARPRTSPTLRNLISPRTPTTSSTSNVSHIIDGGDGQ